MAKFTHLHVHTEYSLLDGSSKIGELVRQAKKLGMESLAITDHGVMYGVVDFYREARNEGIKPIIGCEVYVAPRSRKDKEGKGDAANHHLVLLAENETGYRNLMQLVSFAFTEGFYYKPRIDKELLRQHREGLIGLSACLGGEVSQALLEEDYGKAKRAAVEYVRILGEGNFYLEVQDHGYEEQKRVNVQMARLSRELGIPLAATNDIHYTFEEDARAHDILLCIQTNKKVGDQDRMRYQGGQFFCKSPEEMESIFKDLPEAVANTERIAQRCNVELEFGKLKLPVYPVPSGTGPVEYLRELCLEGLARRYGERAKEQLPRLDYELDVIGNMGYVDYFLIVWDFIKYARDHGIIVGPGRGSAAGSLVSYCLRITDIDPIRYNLIFERFLNPERVSMPDIDIDFCYERRQEVIDYVVEKYGEEKVAQIITFGTMAARAVIRDVGRALDLPYAEVDAVAKMIPQELKMTIEKALSMNKELAALYSQKEEVRLLIDMSKRLEGLPRHSSTHAAGVVICDAPVYAYVPLSSNEGAVTTQFPMNTLEELGLLKMDFLGLRTLTVIQNTVEAVFSDRGIQLDLDNLEYGDPQVYELISSGRTEGVFQLESEGMKSFMKELRPENLEDIIAGISLYRPGPMSSIPAYVQGKRNADRIQYDCKELEPILGTTYGCIVYQEQVMQIVRDLAGYTLGRSDLVRRAMSKKKSNIMLKERQNFIYGNPEEGVEGCVAKGIDEKVAAKIYDDMEDFAKYAFNKSHAAAYAIVAYQTAYLKCKYPVEFMASLISSVMGNTPKVAEYVLELKAMGIRILPPDVNEGDWNFSVSKDSIRFGLSAIRNVGRPVIEALVEERKKNGPYRSMTQLVRRMDGRDLNKRALEGLILAGALDSLGGTRMQYMQNCKTLLDAAAIGRKSVMEGQVNLFDLGAAEEPDAADHFPETGEFPQDQLLAHEKEMLGIYVSGHPLSRHEEEWRRKTSNTSADFLYVEEAQEGGLRVVEGQQAVIGGLLSEKSVKNTRNGQTMAFLTLEDLLGTVEVVVFPRQYEKYKDLLLLENKIFVKGRVTVQEEQDAKLVCDTMALFGEGGGAPPAREAPAPERLGLFFADLESYNQLAEQVHALLEGQPGEAPVFLILRKEKQKKRGEKGVRPTPELLRKLEGLLGQGNVKRQGGTLEEGR
ncbi:DNA polymerase III subunit alpha [Anaerotalea alkaliphila]|uniref:DNA polymerase III subunit alpha n=1 Tax=Anaerotalea alkaliphila TaxID=2662126 RepID=A0A7X5HVZ4_9FIRM|nr:DNA polymerase III subunit alpha [Anaerotalea alkaliphila]NDL67673.1 DNA polymerase III subunit alpha [Anaerotalea alkaliphila]